MSGDAELDAMTAVKDALVDLDEATRERVVWWAAQRFGITLKGVNGTKTPKRDDAREDPASDEEADDDDRDGGTQEFEHFAELYEAVGPQTDHERVLVAAYWAYRYQEKTVFFSSGLNKELKDLGHAVGRMAHAMQWNIDQKPALILQLKKSGTSRQAKKTYKLSHEGIKWVEARLKS
ncbi:MAG: hypothetical protein QM638_11040 [Nocardioides sp.]|uniref:hypothetical protein n=1 Tax=Nocardioides sp. TaxID=35761 RepID=UPI0039E61FA0